MKHLMIILLFSYPLFSFVSDPKPQTAVTVAEDYTDPFSMISEGETLLKEGDLVVRLNRDPMSQYIKNFNRHDKRFSHAGIVLYENGYPYVFHIINGEENPDEKLRKDSLIRFCNPRKNIAYGIFRYDMNAGEIKILRDLIHTWYNQGLQFDSAFNLKSDDRMYCSEMIRKALIKATAKRISIETTKLTNNEVRLFSAYSHHPVSYVSNLQIVCIDELYINPFCHLIKEYNYDN